MKLSLNMTEALQVVRLCTHRHSCEDVPLYNINKGTAKALKKRGLIDIFLVPGGYEFCRLTEIGRCILAEVEGKHA